MLYGVMKRLRSLGLREATWQNGMRKEGCRRVWQQAETWISRIEINMLK